MKLVLVLLILGKINSGNQKEKYINTNEAMVLKKKKLKKEL